MNVPHDQIRDSLVDFVLGQLDEREARRVEAHLAEGCAECNAEILELRETLAHLAATADATPAPAGVRGRVLAAVRTSSGDDALTTRATDVHGEKGERAAAGSDTRAHGATTILRMPTWGRVAVTVLTAACLLLAFDSFQLRRERIGLRNEVALTKARVIQLESEVDESQQWAELVTSGNARFAQLTATPDGDPTMTAWAIFDAGSRRGAVVVENLEPDANRDYELWAIAGGSPRSLGVVETDVNGRAVVRIDRVVGDEPVAAFAVSREPRGGSPDKTAPSGPVILVGPLGD
ncbi:MAG: anti-sigma factor [Candidatus Eisenbacteria bacterium]